MTPASGRWFRVNTTWSQSDWLAALSPAGRLAWIELLSYTKAHGFDGKVKQVTRFVFGRTHGIPAEDVSAMLEAAEQDEAIRIEGDYWIITGWPEHQGDPTGAERLRRHRQRKEGNGDATPVTRYDRFVTPTKTGTSTEPSKRKNPSGSKEKVSTLGRKRVPEGWVPNEGHHEIAVGRGLDLDFEWAKFRDHQFAAAKSDWDATFRNWLRNAKPQLANGGQRVEKVEIWDEEKRGKFR